MAALRHLPFLPNGEPMKKLAIIFVSVIAVVIALAKLSEPGTIPAPDNQKELAAAATFGQAVAARTKATAKWDGIQVEEADGRNYRLILMYKADPSNQAEVGRDTKAVVQAALDELVQQGRRPAEEQLSVTAWAHKPEKGATGQDLTRVYGRAVYDYNNDSVVYKAK